MPRGRNIPIILERGEVCAEANNSCAACTTPGSEIPALTMLHNSRRASAKFVASLCLCIFAQPGASDDWTAEFVFPATTGYVMHNMDVMEVSYKSNYPNASLWCFCYNGKEDPANVVISTCRRFPKRLYQARPAANHFRG